MEAADVALGKWHVVYCVCTEGGREEERPEVIHIAVSFRKTVKIHSLIYLPAQSLSEDIYVRPVLPPTYNLQPQIC